ncbi:hypothetical protein [Calothrix sp. PCC 7507]|uniref:hypothetical protein n=1 Tax=Calothrix sp. PCC 7507 TaxID=99598 RepID=UPI00029F2F32|nr:hypothetical protein [Calothrix sp. PCC 7507]AFY33952.1 hypothetical protein Cal7507_3560 [Calothrix sp. PCC 7507]
MFNKINKLGIATVTGLTLGIISLSGLLSKPAYAGCYKQSLGFPGSWTWVCPPNIPSGSSGGSSCLAVVTKPEIYTISNQTDISINYSLNGKSYTVSPRTRLEHSVGGGSNSCNTSSKVATISFDSSRFRQETQVLREGDSSRNMYIFLSTSSGLTLKKVRF